MKRALLILLFAGAARAGEFSFTMAPAAHLEYGADGKLRPLAYPNDFDGNLAPLYRLAWTQDEKPGGYWGLALWHTGVFGGGEFSGERFYAEGTGALYQTNLLNVGFTNLFVTYNRPLAAAPVTAQVHISVVRQIFKRKEFTVDGVAAPRDLDDVNEISAEGFGFGLTGTHGKKWYWRWQGAAHYYVQLFDAKTDASAGHIFQGESGVGYRFREYAVELGGLWQYWFILGQGNRRVHVAGTDGAVISFNRQETKTGGAYLRISKKIP